MAIFPGLGLNYKAIQANWSNDADYFLSIGLTHIRPHAAGIPIPWDSTTNALWRNCAIYFKSRGFWVEYSLATGTTLTAANWSSYAASVISEITYLAQQGISFDLASVGNELENHVDGTTLTVDQVRPLIRQLVADVKAQTGYTGSIGYDIGYGSATNYDSWNSEGKGAMDMIALHPYGLSSSKFTFVKSDVYKSAILNFAATFGSAGIITEFNLDDDGTRFASLSKEALDFGMREMLSTIRASGIQICLLFQWVGYLNMDNQFAMKNMDGSLNTAWDIALHNNGRRTFIS